MSYPDPNKEPSVIEHGGLWGGRLLDFPVLDSTNSWAKENIESLNHGDVVQARFQSKGRGRLSRRWHAVPERCLTLSMIVRHEGMPEEAPLLGQAAALAVRQLLAGNGIEAECKWPNDVMAGRGKISGILSESVFSLGFVIVGIGLNINVEERELAALNPEGSASSMQSITGKNYKMTGIRVNLLSGCEEVFECVASEGGAWLAEEWKKADWLENETIAVSGPEGILKGRYDGIDPAGRLCLRDGSGERHRFYAGDVKKIVNELQAIPSILLRER